MHGVVVDIQSRCFYELAPGIGNARRATVWSCHSVDLQSFIELMLWPLGGGCLRSQQLSVLPVDNAFVLYVIHIIHQCGHYTSTAPSLQCLMCYMLYISYTCFYELQSILVNVGFTFSELSEECTSVLDVKHKYCVPVPSHSTAVKLWTEKNTERHVLHDCAEYCGLKEEIRTNWGDIKTPAS